jgi:hypothetical protein
MNVVMMTSSMGIIKYGPQVRMLLVLASQMLDCTQFSEAPSGNLQILPN